MYRVLSWLGMRFDAPSTSDNHRTSQIVHDRGSVAKIARPEHQGDISNTRVGVETDSSLPRNFAIGKKPRITSPSSRAFHFPGRTVVWSHAASLPKRSAVVTRRFGPVFTWFLTNFRKYSASDAAYRRGNGGHAK